MAANPRVPPPWFLRGVRNGQQAQQSWIRADRGRGMGGLSGGLRGGGSSPAAGRAGGAWGSGGRRGGAGAALLPLPPPLLLLLLGPPPPLPPPPPPLLGGEPRPKRVPCRGRGHRRRAVGRGPFRGRGQAGGGVPDGGRYEPGRRRRRGAPGARCVEDEVQGEGRGGGSRDGPRGLGSRRFRFGTEPCRGARRPGKGSRGELDGGGGPPRRGPAERKAGPEGRPGKAGRSRPHQGWGFRVMEVQEIVVPKDVVEGKGGRQARCKPRRPSTTGRWGCPSVPPSLPSPRCIRSTVFVALF